MSRACSSKDEAEPSWVHSWGVMCLKAGHLPGH